MSAPRGLFVVGTDTGVGKTRVAAAIAHTLAASGRRVGVLKPLATGATRDGDTWRCDDAEALIEAAGGGIPLDRVAPIVFEEPLAPSVAARRAGTPLQPARVLRVVSDAIAWWAERADVLVVEGVGGLLTPVADRWTLADLAVALEYPLLVVARLGLGTLNHTLMTVECAERRGLRLAGLVLNSAEPEAATPAEATNPDELARQIARVAILAEVPFCVDTRTLPVVLGGIDWYDRASLPRVSVSIAGGDGPGGGAAEEDGP